MLNLFKIPFLSRLRSTEDDLLAKEIETGLIASYLKHKKNLSEEEITHACDVTAAEMEVLRRKMSSVSDDEENYEIMASMLRRIEDGLQRE